MATLTPTLTLASTDATSDTAFTFTVTDALTVDNAGPFQGLSRKTITTADNQELVDEATSGVFYFFPINDGAGLEARADTASCVLEFAFFKKG